MSIGRYLAAAAGLASLAMAALSALAQTTYNGVAFQSSGTQDYIGQGQAQSYTAPPGLFPYPTSRDQFNELQFTFYTAPTSTPDWTFSHLRFAAPAGAVLAPGNYPDAERFASTTKAALDFGFGGRGCNETFGSFEVLEATYDPGDGHVISFAANFQQHCEQRSNPVLYGQFRYNSSIPLTGGGGGSAEGPRLSNLSARGQVMTGDDVLIGGFIIGGTSNKTVMLRARGPSMAADGVPGTLPDPTMTLVRSSDRAVIASNDNWRDAPNPLAMEWANMQPPHPNESGILMSLAPGAYTAIISGVGGAQGVGLFEIFELAQPEVPLANISTRGRVGTGDNVLIGGLIVSGGPKNVLLRARGPSLAAFGITSPLANPMMQLVRASDQAVLETNDDWGSASNAAAISASGYAPSDTLESAIMVTLDPGAYTLVVSGVEGATGIAIVEAFVN